MAGSRNPGPLGRNPGTQDLNDGTMFRGLSPLPGPISADSMDMRANLVTTPGGIIDIRHLVQKIREAGSLIDLQQVITDVFGNQCFVAGVIYGIGEDLITSAVDLIKLCWMFTLADLYDIHTGKMPFGRFISDRDLAVRKVIAEALALFFENEMRKAAEERDALIRELMEALQNPRETFVGILDGMVEGYKKDWKDFWDNWNANTLVGRFNAGRIFGRLLLDVIGIITGVGGAVKLAAKMGAKLPRLIKLAEKLKGKLGNRKKPDAGGGGASATPTTPPATKPEVPGKSGDGPAGSASETAKQADKQRRYEEMKKRAAAREEERKKKEAEAAKAKTEKDRAVGEVSAEAERMALEAAKKDPLFDPSRPPVVGEEAVKKHLGRAGQDGIKMPEFGYWRKDGTFVSVEVKNQIKPDAAHARQKFETVARLGKEMRPDGSGPIEPKRAYELQIPEWWSGKFADPNHKIVNGTLHDLNGPVLIDGAPIKVKTMPFPKP